MSESCLFCRIVRGDIPSPLVGKSENAVAIRDISPQAPAHFLVIPKVHLQSLTHVHDSALLGELLTLANRVAEDHGLSEDGFRVVVNTGENGGQTVQHLHLHVLGGRAMKWPPG